MCKSQRSNAGICHKLGTKKACSEPFGTVHRPSFQVLYLFTETDSSRTVSRNTSKHGACTLEVSSILITISCKQITDGMVSDEKTYFDWGGIFKFHNVKTVCNVAGSFNFLSLVFAAATNWPGTHTPHRQANLRNLKK
jgi:hypothetical protein